MILVGVLLCQMVDPGMLGCCTPLKFLLTYSYTPTVLVLASTTADVKFLFSRVHVHGPTLPGLAIW